MSTLTSFAPTSTEAYRTLARSWAATVTVVTVRRAAGSVAPDSPLLDGFTATAFLTVSMSPPIIAISATASSSAAAMIQECEALAVNLLGADQQPLAGAFARTAGERAGLWEQISWSADQAGVPLLGGTAGAFSARVRQTVEAGDHLLVLGDVTAIHLGDTSDTLVYHNRAYGRVLRAG